MYLFPSLFLFLLYRFEILGCFGGRIGFEAYLYFLQFWHHLRSWFGQIEFLYNSSFLFILHIFDIMYSIAHTSLKLFASCILVNFSNQLITFLLPLHQLRHQLILKIIQLEMFLPCWKHSNVELFKIKDECKQYIHFDLVLAENDLLEFIVG